MLIAEYCIFDYTQAENQPSLQNYAQALIFKLTDHTQQNWPVCEMNLCFNIACLDNQPKFTVC